MGAFEYSIEKLLSERGIEPRYRRPGYGMYLSPLRSENTPSFKVDYCRNLWYDFGMGQGGGPVDLCMLLDRCDIREVMSKLSAGSFVRSEIPEKPPMRILSEGLLVSNSLIGYISSRGISPEVARGHCSELTVEVGEKQHKVIGFMNDAGGWEMRNRYLKISASPKTVTTFEGNDRQCHIFEGFIDYLSFVTLGGGTLKATSVVLNSVTNIPRCAQQIRNFGEIYCWMDNDPAGTKAYKRIGELCPGSKVVDCSVYYDSYKDLNDFLTGKQVEGEKISPEKINRLKL